MGIELPSLSFKLGMGVLMLAMVEDARTKLALRGVGEEEKAVVVERQGRIRVAEEVELRTEDDARALIAAAAAGARLIILLPLCIACSKCSDIRNAKAP